MQCAYYEHVHVHVHVHVQLRQAAELAEKGMEEVGDVFEDGAEALFKCVESAHMHA